MSWVAHKFVAPKAYVPSSDVVKFGMLKMGKAPARAQLYFGIEAAKKLGLSDGDYIAVQIGEGEHDGKFRVVPQSGDEIQIKRKVFRGKAISLSANLGPVQQWGVAKRGTEIVSYEQDDDGGIIITLPKWFEAYRKHAQPNGKILPAQKKAQEVRARLMGESK